MAVLSNTGIRAGASGVSSGYQVEKSLRFDEGDNAKLSRTFAQDGDQTKFTLSFWFKNCDAGASNYKMPLCLDNGGYSQIELSEGYLATTFYDSTGSGWYVYANTSSTHRFRDPAAWYHIVISIDTNAGTTNADRQKIYINGEQLTLTFSTAYGGLMTGDVYGWNTANTHYINMRGSSYGGNWLAAEYYFIDGQALAASDFGETNEDTGKWVPKKYAGTYGPVLWNGEVWSDSLTADGGGSLTNPANGFDNDESTYADSSNGATLDLTGTTFGTGSHTISLKTGGATDVTFNSTSLTDPGGGGAVIWTGTVTGELTTASVVGNASIYYIEVDGKKLVNSTTSVTDNSFYLKFNGTDLGEDSSGNDNDWTVTNLDTRGGDPLYGYVPPGSGTEPYWIDIKPASSDLSYGTEHLQGVLNGSESSGYIYNTGLLATGSGGTCFEQILFDLRDEGTITSLRTHYYCYGTSYDPMHQVLLDADKQEISGSEDDLTGSAAAGGSEWFDFNGYNFSTGTQPRYIKIYYKDGDYTANGRQQLNIIEVNGTKLNNTKYANTDQNSTPNVEGDVLTDTPTDFDDSGNGTGNYCTLNPLAQVGANVGNLRQGNLQIVGPPGWSSVLGTMALPATGKWYFETVIDSDASPRQVNNYACAGFGEKDAQWIQSSVQIIDYGGVVEAYPSTTNTYLHANGTFSLDDVAGWAIDMDNWKFSIYKNGTVLVNSRDIPQDRGTQLWPFCANYNLDYGYLKMNFGQLGFQQTPPTDYKALNTYNLPDPVIADPSTCFDVSIYTGAGSSVDVSTNFSPDLVWVKSRLAAGSHNLIDKVRGDDNYLMTDSTDGEDDSYADVLELKSDGYTVGSNNSAFNGTNGNIGWAWDAGEANTSVSAGGLDASLIDKSQTWSTAGSTTGSTYTGYPWSGVFNENAPHAPFKYTGTGTGNAVHNASSSSTTKYTFAGSGLTGVTSIKLSAVDYNDGELILNEGESDEVVFTGTTYNKQTLYEDTTITTLKSVSVKGISGIGHALFGIIVNGKALIDSGNSYTIPTLASTYRANPSAGFSIVEWTGTTSNETVAHGLNAKPDFMICKKTSTGGNSWIVWHKDIGDTKYLILNSGSAMDTDATLFNSHANDDSNVFSLGTNNSISDTSQTAIAYLWSGVTGYSKFGSYTGNGSTDGPFAWCGFRPAWIMIKAYDNSSGEYWVILDNARDPYNVVDKVFYANLNYAEQDGSGYQDTDFLSNGFRLRQTNGNVNGSGLNYVFAAFAESPFKHTNAR